MVTELIFASPGFRYEDLQATFSEGTKHKHHSIWSSYDKFTKFYDLTPFAVTPDIFSSFITLVGYSVVSHDY